MRRGVRLLAFVALAVGVADILTAARASADDANSLLEVLEEPVVSGASRSAERSTDAPARSSVVTADDLRRFGIRHLDDAINYLSAGMFSHDRLSTSEVGARGFTLTRDSNSHILVVLDGMIVNEQGGGAVYLHDIPIEVIDHLEFILGPGSVLYGGQAMLGVINIVTKAAKHNEGYRASASVGLSPPLDSAGTIKSPTLDTVGHDNRYSLGVARTFSLFKQSAAVVALAHYSDFKGPQIEFAPEPLPKRFDGQPAIDPGPRSIPGAWGGPVNEQWYARTAGAYFKIDVGEFTWSTNATKTVSAMPQMDLFENRVGGVYDDPDNTNSYGLILSNLAFQTRLGVRTTGMVRAYFGYSNTQFDRVVLAHDAPIPGVPLGVIDPDQCPTGPLGPCRRESHFLSRWVGAEVQVTQDWLGDGAYSTMVGVDGRTRTAGYEFVAFDIDSGKSYGSDPAFTRWHAGGNKMANEFAIAPYVQQSIKPHKMVALNAGARIDYDTRIDPKYLRDAISPRLAIIVTPSGQFSFKGIYSTAFRAPSFLEQNAVSGALLPNPAGLRPETVSSYEAIGTGHFGPHTVTLGGFYAKWNDIIELHIVQAKAPNVSHYVNADGIKNFGGTLSYETVLLNQRVRPAINLTMAQAERQLSAEEQARNAPFGSDDTAPITVAPSLYGNARVAVSLDPAERAVVAIAAGYFGRRIADQAYYGGDQSNLAPRPESPAMLALRAVLTGDFAFAPALSYTLGLDYSLAKSQPFVVGPSQGQPRYLVPTPVDAQLAPVNRMTAFAGLAFQLDAGSDAARPGVQGQEPAATSPIPETEQPQMQKSPKSVNPAPEPGSPAEEVAP
jgi:outer membrane receptor protein involved in Fe transport